MFKRVDVELLLFFFPLLLFFFFFCRRLPSVYEFRRGKVKKKGEACRKALLQTNKQTNIYLYICKGKSKAKI